MDAHRRGVGGWAVWTLVVFLAIGGAASRPDGWLLGWPGALAAVAVVAGGLVLARWAGVDTGALGLGLAGLPLLLVVGVAVPGLRALSGPPLLAPALAVLALALARSGRRPWTRRALFPVVLVLYSLVAWRVQVQVGPQGDEPHYLMATRSLLVDGDLALEKDYAEGHYQEFHPAPLSPHYRVRGREGVLYSLHAVGLSILILPAYAVGGYPGVSFFMAFLGALLVREIHGLLRGWLEDEGLAEGVAWLVALSPPLLHYAGLVFTEVPAALGLTLALRRVREEHGAVVGGLAVAALPWLNARYGILSALILLYVIAARPGLRRALEWGGPAAVSAGGLVLFHHLLYGFLDPRRVYGRRPEFSLEVLPQGLPGLFLDQEFGLLVYAPVFALAVPGVIGLIRGRPREGLAVVALVGAAVGTAALWPMWRGGFNPPARFLVPVVPVLAVAVAARLRQGLGAGAALLVGWGLWTGLFGAVDPRLVHRDRDGTAPLFRERSGAEEWTRLLPGYVLDESAGDRVRLGVVWTAALAAAVFVRGRRPATAWGVAGASLGLLAAAASASTLSRARTEGRDAVRVLGRPALSVPGWRRAADARWTPADLAWGPLYEPHRHPAGALVGARLGLRTGGYRLVLGTEAVGPAGDPPVLEVRQGGGTRTVPTAPLAGALEAAFPVAGDRGPVSLALRGGGPFIVKEIRLLDSTFSPRPGLME